jgi:hypothetical protein
MERIADQDQLALNQRVSKDFQKLMNTELIGTEKEAKSVSQTSTSAKTGTDN